MNDNNSNYFELIESESIKLLKENSITEVDFKAINRSFSEILISGEFKKTGKDEYVEFFPNSAIDAFKEKFILLMDEKQIPLDVRKKVFQLVSSNYLNELTRNELQNLPHARTELDLLEKEGVFPRLFHLNKINPEIISQISNVLFQSESEK